MTIYDKKIAVVGMGYVGFPLAIALSKRFNVVGFDINIKRIEDVKRGFDETKELTETEILNAKNIKYTYVTKDLNDTDIFIVTVPTPIDKNKKPNLAPLEEASKLIGSVIKKGAIVVYESTVYPGVTEDVCIPIIEKISGLKYNKTFFAGYSPERINPGDKLRKVTDIVKITSGSNPEVADIIDEMYSSIICAGTFKVDSIRIAEAAKVIENIQRDVNIALINELHQIFTKIGINTKKVIDAASTKWNFMRLYPGMVGGHCIGVDPYYLLHKSEQSGYIPDLIRTAREINDNMSSFIGNDFLKSLVKNKISTVGLKVVILGFTFKENCPDTRNTKVYDLYRFLQDLGIAVEVYDDVAIENEIYEKYQIRSINNADQISANVAIVAVQHDSVVRLIENRSFDFLYNFKS